MKNLFKISLIMVALAIQSSCTKAQLQIFELTSHGEAFIPGQKEVTVFEQKVKFVNSEDYKLYIIPKVTSYTNLKLNADGSVKNQTLIKKDTIYEVFATKKGDSLGIKYNLLKLNEETGKTFKVDSFLVALLIDEDSFKYYDQELGKPTKVLVNGNKKTEIYAIKKNNYAEPDSIYRYYDQDLTDIHFSYSKRLDQLNKSKLYKTTFVMNAIPKDVLMTDIEIPKRTIWNMIRRIEDIDIDLFQEIFKKFENDRIRYKLTR